MAGSWRSGFGSAVGWLLFPVVPTALAMFFYRFSNPGDSDPRQWGNLEFLILLGPLGGFAYLAGATAILPDAPARRGWRLLTSIPMRRANWVALGPWIGFYAIWAWVLAGKGLSAFFAWILGPARFEAWQQSGAGEMSFPQAWVVYSILGIGSYGWLVVAVGAAIRARRQGRLWSSMKRGFLTAIGFLGSLVGGFWAATSAFRAYFFDPRIAPLLIIALIAVATLTGCQAPPTVGDLRRRELFQAMTASWVLGLALAWRWLSRERK